MKPKSSRRDEEYYCTGCSVTFDLENQEYRTSYHHNYFFKLLMLSAVMVALAKKCYWRILHECKMEYCFCDMSCVLLDYYNHACAAAYFHSNK